MTDIRRTTLLTHPLDATPDRVEAYRVELPPGQPVGPHFHPGPVTGYVEHGLIAFERDGQPLRELRPGDVFFEPAGTASDQAHSQLPRLPRPLSGAKAKPTLSAICDCCLL